MSIALTTNKAIFTAVSLDGDSMSEPLLDQDDTIVVLQKPKQASSTSTSTSNSFNSKWFVVFGTVTGFLIQIVSLGAYALMLLQFQSEQEEGSEGLQDQQQQQVLLDMTNTWWPSLQQHQNQDNSIPTPSSLQNMDWLVYGILSILTQIDLIIYVLIWIAFTCTMTKHGMEYLRYSIQDTKLERRNVFVIGVYFLVGIVCGAFIAWSMIDVYLGFPIPFMPIVITVGIDLMLCYLMVWCYDLGRNNGKRSTNDEEEDEEEEEDCESCVCC